MGPSTTKEAPNTEEEPQLIVQNNPEEPDTTNTSSDDSDRDSFHSPGGSQQGSPSNSSDHTDSERADQSEVPEQTDQSETPDQGQDNSGSNDTTPASDDELDNNVHLA